MKRITIEPVSRIEGHAKITIQLDDEGKVADTQFQVTQVRGFEKFTEGARSTRCRELPRASAVSAPSAISWRRRRHATPSWRVRIPRAAQLLREIIHCAQVVQSHALSFFYLSAPDLLLGMDADPAIRNVVGADRANPSWRVPASSCASSACR